ncbi:MAG: hydrogen gas-evolving membrane-bound hydrogenase subunit E [bacterium]
MKGREIRGLIVATGSAAAFAALLLLADPGAERATALSQTVLARGVDDTGAINIVAGVLLDYRGFDTLGEASVIFASVAAVSAAFAGSVVPRTDAGLGLLVRRAVAYLAPLFLLFPAYIVLYGHLSPGGGFQGGVSLAVLLILLTITFGTRKTASAAGPGTLHTTEALSAGAFVLVGVVGIVGGASFLANLAAGFPRGVPGDLWSAGAIPLLNVIIGAKVASGLGSIFYDLLSTRGS